MLCDGGVHLDPLRAVEVLVSDPHRAVLASGGQQLPVTEAVLGADRAAVRLHVVLQSSGLKHVKITVRGVHDDVLGELQAAEEGLPEADVAQQRTTRRRSTS